MLGFYTQAAHKKFDNPHWLTIIASILQVLLYDPKNHSNLPPKNIMLPPPPKKKMNPLLMKVIFISVGIHVIAGLIAGVVTIANIVIPEETQFEEPPAIEEVAPPAEVKVQIQPQQPKPQQAQSLTMRPVANIAVANVDVNLPDMEQNFTVSTGLGGLGGGQLLGGASGSIGIGLSDVNVFGLKAKAERILFVIDASRYMVYDDKGGLPSYQTIKNEIVDMVANLSAGTLYNVMLVSGYHVKLFKPQLTPAGTESTQQLAQWLAPVNSALDKVGFQHGAPPKLQTQIKGFEDVYRGLQRWPVQLAMLQYSLEMGVDAIFELMGNHQGLNNRIRLEYSPEEIAKYNENKEKFLKRNPRVVKEIADHEAEIPKMRQRIKEAHAKLNQQRKSKGLPPKVLTTHVYHDARILELEWEHPRPNHPEINGLGVRWLEQRNVRRYLVELIRTLYDQRDQKPPIVNVILFLAGDQKISPAQEKGLKDYVGLFRGKYRLLRGLNEIQSAATAKGTKNRR
jgi:hypothetical protein